MVHSARSYGQLLADWRSVALHAAAALTGKVVVQRYACTHTNVCQTSDRDFVPTTQKQVFASAGAARASTAAMIKICTRNNNTSNNNNNDSNRAPPPFPPPYFPIEFLLRESSSIPPLGSRLRPIPHRGHLRPEDEDVGRHCGQPDEQPHLRDEGRTP